MQDDLQKITDALMSIANQLAEVADEVQKFCEKYVPVNDAVQKVNTAETVEQKITLEQVRGVLAEKSRAGHTAAVRDLLKKHGADKLSAVKQECYAALLADAEALCNG